MDVQRLAGLAGPLLVLALLGAPAAGAQALPGNGFAITEHEFYLSPDQGDAGGQSDVLLLVSAAPSEQTNLPFVAPGLALLGVVQQQGSEAWYSQGGWDKDLEIVFDSEAVLYFAANPQGLAAVTVRLYDVAADGQAVQLAVDEREFVSVLSDTAVLFELPTAGVRLLKGHVLALEVSVDAPNGAVVLQYGGATPSGLVGLATRWLDSDGDGLPDSNEAVLGRNPLDANEPTADFIDTDDDGLADEAEARIGSDESDADSDDDGWLDGLEAQAGSDPLDPASMPVDSDGDGLPDTYESTYFGDLAQDSAADPDADGCSNLREALRGTDPSNPDSDGDGVDDCDEMADGTDPSNSASVLSGPGRVPEPVATAAFFAAGSSLCLVPLIRRR
ncbi:MAG: hypothetical protein WC876_05945 [Candidatus Thermoplasmatota archaeon]|jgi:hypothetical protein